MEEQLISNLRCLIKYPKSFIEGSKCPLLIYLHGAGTRGSNMNLLVDSVFFQITGKYSEFPFAVAAPLCEENTWFDVWEHLKSFVLEVMNLPCVDKSRVYIMGASMGGYATWQLAMSMPEYFAAIAPICGGGMYWNAGRLVHTPIWAFHGQKDHVVFAEESIKMVDAVNKNGGNAKLTIYPDRDHDAWTDAYSNPEVFAWLLQHRKLDSTALTDQYNNPDLFG